MVKKKTYFSIHKWLVRKFRHAYTIHIWQIYGYKIRLQYWDRSYSLSSSSSQQCRITIRQVPWLCSPLNIWWTPGRTPTQWFSICRDVRIHEIQQQATVERVLDFWLVGAWTWAGYMHYSRWCYEFCLWCCWWNWNLYFLYAHSQCLLSFCFLFPSETHWSRGATLYRYVRFFILLTAKLRLNNVSGKDLSENY